MPLFQGIELRIDSGAAGTTKMAVERLQSVSIPLDFQRADIRTLNRFRPEVNRPIINYTPVNLSFEYIRSDNIVESALGLINPTGVICGLTNAKSVTNYGVRNFEILQSPLESANYIGQFTIHSGVLSSYSVSASVGDLAKTSIGFQALDIGWSANTGAKTGVNYSTTVVPGRNTNLSGIDFSGFGISGFSAESISIGINISRVETIPIGSKFPTDRQIVDASASIQIRGYLEGGNAGLTGLGAYDCGSPTSGSIYITLVPSCGGGAPTTYRAVNPYVQSISQSFSVGNLASVDMSFSIPLPISSSETGSASNLIIS